MCLLEGKTVKQIRQEKEEERERLGDKDVETRRRDGRWEDEMIGKADSTVPTLWR